MKLPIKQEQHNQISQSTFDYPWKGKDINPFAVEWTQLSRFINMTTCGGTIKPIVKELIYH